jgi:hypothetical protein
MHEEPWLVDVFMIGEGEVKWPQARLPHLVCSENRTNVIREKIE